MRAASLTALLLLTACNARFNGTSPRPYRCGSPDAGECPGGWTCNLAALECIDPDAGLPLACGSDTDCGGGWRCSPARVCVDRSVEGPVTTASLATGATLLSPRYPSTGALKTSEPVLVQVGPSALSTGTDLLIGTEAPRWVLSETALTETGTTSLYLPGPATAVDPSAIVTTRLVPGGYLHSLWSLADGGVLVSSVMLDAPDGGSGLSRQFISGAFTGLSVIRSPGILAGPGPSLFNGAALLIAADRSESWQALTFDAGWTFPAGTTSVAWFDQAGHDACTPFLSVLTGQHLDLKLPDASVRLTLPGPFVEQRTGFGVDLPNRPSALGALDSSGTIVFLDACNPGAYQPLLACPDGGVLDGWSFRETSGALTPERLCTTDSQQRAYLAGRPPRAIYDSLQLSAEGTLPWSRSEFTSTLSSYAPDGTEEEVSMAEAPDALIRSLGTVTALRGASAFMLTPLGLLRSSLDFDQGAAVAAGDGRFFARRNGVVTTTTWAAAYPSSDWPAPRAPVLMRTLALVDGGTLLALAHDDTVDIAQLMTATREPVQLTPAIVPSPGLAVTDLALHLSADGGFASGYAIASGFLISLTATSPTRWLSNRVTLPIDALHVYYDGERPRAVLADGTVLGLTAMVGLTPPTPEPGIAATSSCGAPIVLTEDAVYQLTADGWHEVAGVTSDVGFAFGRLLTLDGGVYAFDRVGHGWTFDVPCP